MSNLKDIISEKGMSLPEAASKGFDRLFVFTVVKLFGRLAYDKKYLRGKWFERPWSPGWRWAYNGMFSKLFTGANRGIPWPCSSHGIFTKDIDFHVDDLNNFQSAVYFQAFNGGHITLGRDVWIARGTCLITTNHDPDNLAEHLPPEDIVIGDHCWLGANVVVMPGVELGPHTIVGANAVVTKSFPDGFCVLGGVPAKVIKELTTSDNASDLKKETEQ